MKIVDIIRKNFLVEERVLKQSRLPPWLGGGTIKLSYEIDDKDGSLIKFSYVYANTRFCNVDNGRVVGVDSAHPSHRSSPHVHLCGITKDLPSNLTLFQIKDIFFNEVEKVMLEKVIKPKIEQDGVLYESIIDVPEIMQFSQDTEILLKRAEQARIKGEKLYSGLPLTIDDIGNNELYNMYVKLGDYKKAKLEYDRLNGENHD